MTYRKFALMTVAGLAALAVAQSASAQKSKDTLRIAINDPFSTLDSYHFPQDEVGYFSRDMYGRLVAFDERTKKFIPELAKSWKRISPTILEFELRDDIKFTSGNKFSAEDVKHTLSYLADPKVKIRFKGRYTWVKNVEIINPYKIRIVSKRPFSTDMSTIAYRFHIYDSKIHKALKDKASYGRVSASTTGMYRMVSIDNKKGVVLERVDSQLGKFPHKRAPIKHIQGIPMPDRQTQIAQLFTGGVDVLRNITADNARDLKGRPGITITPTSAKSIMYMIMDAVGRSANKALMDVRVRKAIIKAINRELLVKTLVAGGASAELPKSICFKSTTACSDSRGPEAYDPAGAKRLLKEAGLEKGFDLKIAVFAPIRQIAEAMAGDLRKVGIRATIESMPLISYVKKRARGELTAFTGYYPTAAQPDVANLMNFFFRGNRDYYKDKLIAKAAKAGASEFDLAKRTAIYAPALNRVNEMAYIFPISELPIVFAHSDTVQIKPNLQSVSEIRLSDYFWK